MNAQTPKAGLGKILVIDDNPIIQRTVYFALRDRGYKVFMSGEIAEALKIVHSERPDLVLLDITFPADGTLSAETTRDGFWALDWMSRMEEMRGVPIIVISSTDPAEFEARARAAGAAAYYRKPLNKDELAAAIGGLLAKKNSVPPPAAA